MNPGRPGVPRNGVTRLPSRTADRRSDPPMPRRCSNSASGSTFRDHTGTDLGCGGRSNEIRGMDGVLGRLVRPRLRTGVQVGLRRVDLGSGRAGLRRGTAIHVNAGVAALAAVLVLGRRRGWPEQASPPHSMPLVMLGAGILWFGFNAGSALAANGQAIQAFLNTFVAAAAAGLVWGLVEK